jgi:hypothetical protein
MLDETHDFYSLIFLFKLFAVKNPTFFQGKDSLLDTGLTLECPRLGHMLDKE